MALASHHIQQRVNLKVSNVELCRARTLFGIALWRHHIIQTVAPFGYRPSGFLGKVVWST